MASCLLDCFEFSDRHTSENLAEELHRVAREWGMENKVVCCVTDNAANITKAIQLLKWTHHPCLAHTINLFVRNALKAIKPTVDKVKAIVEFFHRSTAATQKLKSTQRQMSMAELKLKQECVTRWNSAFHMIQRILESKDAVIATLAVINAPVAPLSQEEWEALQEASSAWSPLTRSQWRSAQRGTVFKHHLIELYYNITMTYSTLLGCYYHCNFLFVKYFF
jgi:hypothetical protein